MRISFSILFIFSFSLLWNSSADGQYRSLVENITVRQEEGTDVVHLSYNLNGNKEMVYRVSVELSQDGGRTFTIFPKSVTGDVGLGVKPGRRKHIIWYGGKDYRELTGTDFVFKIIAKEAKEIIWEKDDSKMVYIPGGEFLMGSQNSAGKENKNHQHKVYLSPYYIDKYEVTNRQFLDFLNRWGRDTDEKGNRMIYDHDWGIKKIGSRFVITKGYENYPVVNITWYGAVQYARWAGKRLPTEAEWEKACKAGSNNKYCFGDDEAILNAYAWLNKNSRGKTSPVGQKKPNVFGIYDMHGNIWEWCQDWFDSGYYRKSPSKNPYGPDKGTERIIRGGSWYSSPGICSSANRGSSPSSNFWFNFGFRCAVSASGK